MTPVTWHRGHQSRFDNDLPGKLLWPERIEK
jgi:hypothetical protein